MPEPKLHKKLTCVMLVHSPQTAFHREMIYNFVWTYLGSSHPEVFCKKVFLEYCKTHRKAPVSESHFLNFSIVKWSDPVHFFWHIKITNLAFKKFPGSLHFTLLRIQMLLRQNGYYKVRRLYSFRQFFILHSQIIWMFFLVS